MNLTLREYTDKDLRFMALIREDPDLQSKLFATPPDLSKSEIAGWAKRRCYAPLGNFFIVSSKDQPIGCVQLYNIDPASKSAEISICIAPKFQGNGFGKQALQLLHEYAKDKLKLNRLALSVSSTNTVAVSLYEKAGYKPFGIMMQTTL